MKVLLLFAGKSRRFWPLTEKSFFPLCGKTLLEHQVGRLRKGGCSDIILVGGAHNLKEAREIFPVIPAIEQEDEYPGMHGALVSALPSVGAEPVMIVSGNDVVEPEAYESLRQRARSPGVDGAILAQRVQRYFPGGYLQMEGDRICSIMEKPGEGNEPSDLVNVVAHAHPSAALLLRALQRTAGETDDGYERALDSLFHTHVYHAVRYTNVWQAVKYPWHVIPLLPTLLSDIREPLIAADARIHPTAVIEGNVIIERGVNIFPHATVRGPCYIGKNTMIGNSALVWESSVGDHCVIGYGTEVKGSVLAGHVWTHSTYIGDSVIGKNVSFGAGSVAGNLRLDEGEIYSIADGKRIGTGLRKFGTAIGDDCRIGIHTSINPGIKVGRGSFLGTNVVATRDIPDGSFVSMKNGEMNVKKNISPPPEPNGREVFRRKAEQKHRIPA